MTNFGTRNILSSFLCSLYLICFSTLSGAQVYQDDNKSNAPAFLPSLFSLLLPNSSDNKNWVLVWEDDFDGTEIDPDKWEIIEDLRRNNETGPDTWWLRENVYLDGNSKLVIKTNSIDNRNISDTETYLADTDDLDYATGAIRSKDKYEKVHGKFEIRCKFPSQPGWWAAFWLFTKNMTNVDGTGIDGAEIDIMEGFGWNDKVWQSIHWDGYGADHKVIGHWVYNTNVNDGNFHTFTLEWTPTEYHFYIDGNLVWNPILNSPNGPKGVSTVPQYIKINGELSTDELLSSDIWANDPELADFPDYYIIDYIKVYDLESD